MFASVCNVWPSELEVLVLRGGTCLLKTILRSSLNLTLLTQLRYFEPPTPHSSKTIIIKRVTILAKIDDHDYHEEVGLLLCTGGRKKYAWNWRDSLRYFLVLPVAIGLFHGDIRKAFWGPMRRRMRCSAKMCWRRNRGLSPGAQLCLIQNQVAQFKSSLVFNQAQKKGQGSEMSCHYLESTGHLKLHHSV